MAKIATAHIEIKPVLNEDALQGVLDAIEQAVAIGFSRGVKAVVEGRVMHYGDPGERTPEEVAALLVSLGHNISTDDK